MTTEINNNVRENSGKITVDASTNEAGRDLNRDSIRDPWGCISMIMLALIGLAALVSLIWGAWS